MLPSHHPLRIIRSEGIETVKGANERTEPDRTRRPPMFGIFGGRGRISGTIPTTATRAARGAPEIRVEVFRHPRTPFLGK